MFTFKEVQGDNGVTRHQFVEMDKNDETKYKVLAEFDTFEEAVSYMDKNV